MNTNNNDNDTDASFLNCRMNVDPEKIVIIQDMLDLQHIVFFQEIEDAFKVRNFPIPSFIFLSVLKQESPSDRLSDYIFNFPAYYPADPDLDKIFHHHLGGRCNLDWHDLRALMLQHHDLEMDIQLEKRKAATSVTAQISVR